jgi:hypothetical protein
MSEDTHALARVRPGPPAIVPTGLKTDGQQDGIIELQMPNLLPTDNVEEVADVRMKRRRIPVRITKVDVHCIDNGFVVNLPQAGRQSDYGPDGSKHAFTTKLELLEFIGQVIGQVTYQYVEQEIFDEESKTDGAGIVGGDGYHPTPPLAVQ